MPDGIAIYDSGYLLLGLIHDQTFGKDYYKIYNTSNNAYGYANTSGGNWISNMIIQYIAEFNPIIPDLGNM